MNLNEIKIGAKLACDAKIAEIDGDVVYIEFSAHKKFRLAAELVELLDAQNAATAPKYDPCRLFKKGDKVRVVTYKGRNKTGVQAGEIGSIYKNEKDADIAVEVIFYGDDLWEVDPAYLELVTPVEEQEPYSVGESIDGCILYKNGDYYAEFLNSEDAQRACKLLNAEHRKEQSNG